MSVASAFDVRIDRSARQTVVRLIGELDLATCEHMRQAVADDALWDAPVVFDLSALKFCDSSGLRELLDLHRRAAARETPLRLAGVSAEVNRVFELTGALQYFDVYPDVAEALADPAQGSDSGSAGKSADSPES
ncbi:STAS domain-containing protein [Actinospica durhamensis]|nr:STAS domain-containing protein [Actinospica durhamensis]